MYILQIVHWNPDKTIINTMKWLLKKLCISFKLFIEILIKQFFPEYVWLATVVYILQIVHWNPDKTIINTMKWLLKKLCISFKLFIEILIKQFFPEYVWLATVVYILQIVHWNPDKTILSAVASNRARLCISFKLFIEILIKQWSWWWLSVPTCCVYPSNCSLKSW